MARSSIYPFNEIPSYTAFFIMYEEFALVMTVIVVYCALPNHLDLQASVQIRKLGLRSLEELAFRHIKTLHNSG